MYRHSVRRGAPLLSITAAVLSGAMFAPAALAFNPQPDPPGRQPAVADTTTASFTTIAGAPNPVTTGAPFTVSGAECDRVADVAPTGTLEFIDTKTGVSLGTATLTPDPTYENCADASVTDTEALARGSYRMTALYQPGGSTPAPASPKASYIEKVVDPLGEVYVGSNAGEIFQLGFGSTGLLSPLSPSTISGEDLPFDTAVSPNGEDVYATNCGGNDLLQFKVLSGGTLQADSQPTVPGGACPEFLTVSPNGKSVYMTNTGSTGTAGANTVSQYTVLSNGTLKPKSPASVPTGGTPIGVTVTPNGDYAYIANSGDGTISEFAVAANGTLSPLSPATVPTFGYPIDVAVSPDGKGVYVTCYSGAIAQYDVGANGVLTPMSPAEVSTGIDPGSYYLAIGQTGTGADQVTSVYAADAQNDTIAQFSATANGTLTPDSPAALSSPDPVGIAVDDATNTVYVTNSEEGTVSQFTVAPDGTLSPATPATIAVGAAPWGIAIRR